MAASSKYEATSATVEHPAPLKLDPERPEEVVPHRVDPGPRPVSEVPALGAGAPHLADPAVPTQWQGTRHRGALDTGQGREPLQGRQLEGRDGFPFGVAHRRCGDESDEVTGLVSPGDLAELAEGTQEETGPHDQDPCTSRHLSQVDGAQANRHRFNKGAIFDTDTVRHAYTLMFPDQGILTVSAATDDHLRTHG